MKIKRFENREVDYVAATSTACSCSRIAGCAKRRRLFHGRSTRVPRCAYRGDQRWDGSAVVQRLKVNVPGVIEINPEGGKDARMSAVAPEWQAGDWYVDRNAGWTEPFIEQITMFPNARNDDMCDAMSQASAWLLQRPVNSVRMSDAFSGRVIYEYTW